MVEVLLNSEPDLEIDFEVVINVGVGIGAGETCEVSAALEWSIAERRTDDPLPHLDRHWQRTANSPESIERLKYGLRREVLLQTHLALRNTVDWEREDLSPERYRDVRRALDILERAIAIARKAHDYMYSVPSQLEPEKFEKDS